MSLTQQSEEAGTNYQGRHQNGCTGLCDRSSQYLGEPLQATYRKDCDLSQAGTVALFLEPLSDSLFFSSCSKISQKWQRPLGTPFIASC